MAILRLLRPKQWTKGLIVFAAILFTDPFRNGAGWLASGLAFIAFGFVSAATYVFNDIMDAEKDRLHPTKKLRPIASGEVTVPVASVVGLAMLLLAAGALAFLPLPATYIVLTYLAIQILYNVSLKQQAIADVFCLSSGFVLRAAIGAAAMGVQITYWLLYCTFALALMLGFGKRRGEILLLGNDATRVRKSLGDYSLQFLDYGVVVCATASLLGYGVYCIESPTARQHPALIITYIWVAYAVFRYLLLAFQSGEGGEPENLFLRDRPLQIAVGLYALSAAFAMSPYAPVAAGITK